MAILPLPPSGVAFIDPITGGVSVQWQNYLLSLTTIGGGFAPIDAEYWVSAANATLTNETNLGSLTSGYMKLTVAAAVGTPSTVTAIPASDISGTIGLAHGGTGADLSATGGTNQVLQQASAGAAITVGALSGSTITGAALSKTDDTNVTLTLGGTPTTALLRAASITAGWTGQLGLARGGTNADLSATGGANQVLKQSTLGGAITVGTISGAALSKVNDTNVTLTLGGTPTTALLAATSLTLGWTGTLAVGRGGTGADLSATGGTSQVLQQSTAGAAVTVGQLGLSNLSSFVAWGNYGASSTIVGWSSLSNQDIWYTRVGNMVWVAFFLNGTSNSTAISFTLPITASATNPAQFDFQLGLAVDNGAAVTTLALGQLVASSATVNIYPSAAAGNWTSSGAKKVGGQFFYVV